MNTRRVLLGIFFTLAGLVSLMVPAFPFICIGALIFGPIELIIGLAGENRAKGARIAWTSAPPSGWASVARPPVDVARVPTKYCPHCGTRNGDPNPNCTKCGEPLPGR
ncbi:MAG TPA: hypothetical protein VJP06_02425 [Thermoplasmata archaeon]|nr:hypothetical protein [Thermoplasmata archaeon]